MTPLGPEVIIATDSQAWALREAWTSREAELRARDGLLAISVREVVRLAELEPEAAREAAAVLGCVKAAIPGAHLVEAKAR